MLAALMCCLPRTLSLCFIAVVESLPAAEKTTRAYSHEPRPMHFALVVLSEVALSLATFRVAF